MNIIRFEAKEIFDASGNVALACFVDLEDGTRVNSSIPSNFFTHVSIADHGKFITKTIQKINSVFAPVIAGRVPDIKLVDAIIFELNDENGESSLHPSVLFLMSSVVCKAQAVVYQCEVFELLAELSGAETVSLPFPLITLLDGIFLSSNHKYPVEKIFLIPIGAADFRTSCQYAFRVIQEVRSAIAGLAKHTCSTADGALSLTVDSLYEPFDIVVQALKKTELNDVFVLGIACNAEAAYNITTKTYNFAGQEQTPQELCAFYKKLASTHPLFSVEDSFARQDVEGWSLLHIELGTTLQMVGNKSFVMWDRKQLETVSRAEEEGVLYVNSVVIQPYQIGTITEAIVVVNALKELDANVIIAHAEIETNETFLADFAVGISAGQIKVGGLSRGEHIAKYNRLLEIEDALILHALDQID